MRALRPLFLLGMVIALAACSTGGGALEPEDVIGTWGEEGAMGSPHVILTEDGRVAGSDGCNRMMGDWRIEEGEVVFGPIATTMMYCEGVDTSLNQMHTARPATGGMEFLDEGGEVLATLERTD